MMDSFCSSIYDKLFQPQVSSSSKTREEGCPQMLMKTILCFLLDTLLPHFIISNYSFHFKASQKAPRHLLSHKLIQCDILLLFLFY